MTEISFNNIDNIIIFSIIRLEKIIFIKSYTYRFNIINKEATIKK